MQHQQRIIVAHADPETRQLLESAAHELGHEIVGVYETGRQIIEGCRQHRPDIVITGVKMAEIDGIDALIEVAKEEPLPGILVTSNADIDLVERAVEDHVMAYLVEPVTKKDLKPAIHLVVLRFEQFQALREQVEDLTEALNARKVIEKAKGILMRRNNLDEDHAYRRLQKLASAERKKLVEVAQALITSDKALK